MQDPTLVPTLEQVLGEETAGDPMGRRPKAKRGSLAHLTALRQEFQEAGKPVICLDTKKNWS